MVRLLRMRCAAIAGAQGRAPPPHHVLRRAGGRTAGFGDSVCFAVHTPLVIRVLFSAVAVFENVFAHSVGVFAGDVERA